MANERKERIATISGKNGYVQLLEEELKAYSIAIFFSATNIGETNYFSYEWYKKRTLYGRVRITRGEYCLKEHLIQYQNDCIYEETATLYETVKRLQCEAQKQYEFRKYVREGLAAMNAFFSIPLFPPTLPTASDQIPPQPIGVPGLQVDGIYYNMFPGCAGELTIQTWYDDDICKDVNGNPLTKDNRGKPPDPKVAGDPPSGTDANVPPPDYSPNSSYEDPNPRDDVPTDKIKDPTLPEGEPGRFYIATFRDTIIATGEVRVTFTLQILGKYGSLERYVRGNNSSYDYRIQTAIGVAGVPQPNYTEVFSGTGGTLANPTIRIDLVSIVPQ
jgi:hypothetical protein